MKQSRGFALILTLLLVLILTLFGFSLLLLAGNYYASTRNLFEKENARLACDQALRLMIDRHNFENGEPRFFHNTTLWPNHVLAPYMWNDHEVGATLEKAWNPDITNVLRVSTRKGPYASARTAELRQRRLEDFAFYLDGTQQLIQPALFEGPVFAQIELAAFGSAFRGPVQGSVEPESAAAFHNRTQQSFAYPPVSQVLDSARLPEQAMTAGRVISSHNALFWQTDHYEVNLDLLTLDPVSGNKWRVKYNGSDLGTIKQLIFWFDDIVAVSQQSILPVFSSQQLIAPIYFHSAVDVRIRTHLHPLAGSTYRHPLALIAAGAVYVDSSAPAFVTIEAFVGARGSHDVDGIQAGLIVEPGGTPLGSAQLSRIRAEILSCTFLLEDQLKTNALSALASGGRAVWFRGGLALSEPVLAMDPSTQLHFQASADRYTLIPALPFVHIVEGSRSWQ